MYHNIFNFISTVFLDIYIFKEFIKYHLLFKKYNTMIINICEELRKKNILYVKIIQWNIQDYYNIDNELKQYFYKFSSNVPYTKNDIDYVLINQVQTHFKHKLLFNDIPINSGTTALVFKGNMEGKQVAIKMLRKNIYHQITVGIENIQDILNRSVYVLSFFYKINKNLNSLINNNKQLLLDQCNLLNEIKNMELFSEKTIAYPNIVIPHVYKEFTEFNNNLIVMDYLDGHHINDVTIDKVHEYNKIVQQFILNSYFLFKVIHADLHPGNLILLDNNKVGIIDFGIIVEINNKQCNNIFQFFIGLANANVNMIKKTVTNLLLLNESDTDKIKSIIDEPLEMIRPNLFNKREQICVNNLIRAIRMIITKLDGNINIHPSASQILLSIISSVHTLEKFSKCSTLTDTIKNHLSSNTFFD